jgi:hypothetical protein
MQILTINNRNFQIPSRNPSIRTKVKILKKNVLDSSSNKFIPRMLSHRGNVRTSKFWQKSKEKNPIFFRKFTKDIKGFDLGQKKFKIISCLCTFKINICMCSYRPVNFILVACVQKLKKELLPLNILSALWRER